MDIYGHLWKYMKIYGNIWKFMIRVTKSTTCDTIGQKKTWDVMNVGKQTWPPWRLCTFGTELKHVLSDFRSKFHTSKTYLRMLSWIHEHFRKGTEHFYCLLWLLLSKLFSSWIYYTNEPLMRSKMIGTPTRWPVKGSNVLKSSITSGGFSWLSSHFPSWNRHTLLASIHHLYPFLYTRQLI